MRTNFITFAFLLVVLFSFDRKHHIYGASIFDKLRSMISGILHYA